MNSPSDNLGQFPNLRLFDLDHRMHYKPSEDLSLNNIFQLFNVDRVMNHLDIIRLKLAFRQFNIPNNFLEPRLEPGWVKLDKMLAGPLYPSLSQVMMKVEINTQSLEITSAPDIERFRESVTEQLKECFLRLSTSDRISFNLIVQVY